MVDVALLRRVALALPDTEDASEGVRLIFKVGAKGFAWSYFERVAPKKPRVLRPDILAIRCPLDHKAMLIEGARDIFFDDDHYRGYPAVLVRFAKIGRKEAAALLKQAWLMSAPRRLLLAKTGGLVEKPAARKRPQSGKARAQRKDQRPR